MIRCHFRKSGGGGQGWTWKRDISRLICLAAILLAVFAWGADAQSTLKIELNKLETRENACRAYFLFENSTKHDFSGFKLDLVVFGQDGVITKRLAVDVAPLPASKTTVKLFDIEGHKCNGIGRILINDVLDCRDKKGTRPDCVSLVAPASRSPVPFVK